MSGIDVSHLSEENDASGSLQVRSQRTFVRCGRWIDWHPTLVRVLLCGPVTLLLVVLLMMGAAHWVPSGAANINNLALPVILFPLIWAFVFFYALWEDNLVRGVAIMFGAVVAHIIFLAVVM